MTRRRVAAAGLVLVLALLASGCRKVISQTYLERTVEQYLRDMSGVDVAARCPSGQTMRADRYFFCTTRAYGRTGTVLVHQLDDYGRVELSTEDPLNRAEVERKAREHLFSLDGVEVDGNTRVTCPRRIVPRPGNDFTCDSDVGSIAVRQVDGLHRFVFTLEGRDVER